MDGPTFINSPPVGSDDLDFFAADARELYRHAKEPIFLFLIIGGEGILMHGSPQLSCQRECQEQEEHLVTYQLTLPGNDGMVVASDQCENMKPEQGEVRVKNLVRKVFFSGRFAWAYFGGALGPIFAEYVSRNLVDDGIILEGDARTIFENCGNLTLAEYTKTMTGPAGKSEVILACGATKRIFRATISSPMTTVEIAAADHPCITGNYLNLAAFLPTRFYSRTMSVDKLTSLAAYSIYAANALEPMYVDGLDVAIYRDSVGKFEFLDSETCWRNAANTDERIRSFFQVASNSLGSQT